MDVHFNTQVNYATWQPSFSVGGHRKIGPGGTVIFPADVLLTGVQSEEVATVVGIYLRMGLDVIRIERNDPLTFGVQLPEDSGDTCLDCGGDIYGPGAPAICAAGHKCRTCDEYIRDCVCPRKCKADGCLNNASEGKKYCAICDRALDLT